MTIREQLEQDKVLEPYYYFIKSLDEEEIMENKKQKLVKRLGEIKTQLDYLKYQENALNVEYENILLELWELLPVSDDTKVIKKGIKNARFNK